MATMKDNTSALDALLAKARALPEAGITEETDPLFTASPAAGITAEDIDKWNAGGGGGSADLPFKVFQTDEEEEEISTLCDYIVANGAGQYLIKTYCYAYYADGRTGDLAPGCIVDTFIYDDGGIYIGANNGGYVFTGKKEDGAWVTELSTDLDLVAARIPPIRCIGYSDIFGDGAPPGPGESDIGDGGNTIPINSAIDFFHGTYGGGRLTVLVLDPIMDGDEEVLPVNTLLCIDSCDYGSFDEETGQSIKRIEFFTSKNRYVAQQIYFPDAGDWTYTVTPTIPDAVTDEHINGLIDAKLGNVESALGAILGGA